MRLSCSFWQTYKEIPADAEIPSHQLMLRAGLIHKSGAGLYNYLPFGLKVLQKITQIVREEMNRAGASELQMTMVTPSELWKESGRWDLMTEMCKFKDKRDSEVCLSPTNEEAIVEILRKSVKSYKNLPLNLYQINTKFRDEIRPRFGLMRAREFLMKDAYSFHVDKDCLDQTYQGMYEAYTKIFNRLGLNFVAVIADAGAMASSDQKTHEFQVLAETGEDAIAYAEDGSYAANLEKADTLRVDYPLDLKEKALIQVDTPAKQTIAEVCDFLKCPLTHSLKSLVYKNDETKEFFLLMLLGDDQLNEIKLKAYLGADSISPATDSELLSLGLPKGYIGPKGIDSKKIKTIYDSAVKPNAYYTVGAMEEGKHYTGFCPQRDDANLNFTSLRMATAGDKTLEGGKKILLKRGIEVGHIFQLGDKYTKAMNFSVLDQNGKAQFPLMGCYGVGVSRLIAAAIEQSHDEKGIIWPNNIAPFDLHFIAITKSDEFASEAEKIYQSLIKDGLDVLFDDRKVGPGFKFKDADLLGVPLQLIFGERDFAATGELELVNRKTGEKQKVSPAKISSLVKDFYRV